MSGLPAREEWLPWVAPARAGDRLAGQRLFEALHPGLHQYLLHMTHDATRAADLTQETFARALTALGRLRRDEAFRGWLYQIAHNLVRDTSAKATEVLTDDETTLDQPDREADPARQVLAAELRETVRSAVATLPPDQREVVVLHHFEGLEVETISEILAVRAGTVKSRLARGREALRRRLLPLVES